MAEKKPFELRIRTSIFAREVLHLCQKIPPGNEVGTIKRQLFRAATSVGANYRSALREKSRRDFVSKLSIVEEEADRLYLLAGALGCFKLHALRFHRSIDKRSRRAPRHHNRFKEDSTA